jgi:hypothetical protein
VIGESSIVAVDAITEVKSFIEERREARSTAVDDGMLTGVDAAVGRGIAERGRSANCGARDNATNNEFSNTGFGTDPSKVDTMT